MGVIKVEKLHAILLMEADFNFFNGLMFVECMMCQAKAQDCIPLEIYGSRKNHEAVEVAITNCHLIADIPHQKCIPDTIALVDAESCYDCIAHVAGSLCTQNWDVDPQGTAGYHRDATYHSTDEILLLAHGLL